MQRRKYIPVLVSIGGGMMNDKSRSNYILLGREGHINRFGLYVEVPINLLSASAIRLLTLVKGNLSGGRINHESMAVPHLRIRRRRVSIARAAEMLGYDPAITTDLFEMYEEDGVGEKIVEEAFPDGLLPRATDPTLLARQINRLANRGGIFVDLPRDGGRHVVNAAAPKIEEEAQVSRWKFLLDRAAARARRAAIAC